VYRLLDAHYITEAFLHHGGNLPTAERQVRPLKKLLSVANGQGKRIPDVWEIAVTLADGGIPRRRNMFREDRGRGAGTARGGNVRVVGRPSFRAGR
jgi:hypothetical protein